MFRETSCFVITLGLAEVWFQKRKRPPRECAGESKGEGEGERMGAGGGGSGGGGGGGGVATLAGSGGGEGAAEGDETDVCDVLWRAVPSDRYDPKRHGFRVTSLIAC
jgi:hypothetical protein